MDDDGEFEGVPEGPPRCPDDCPNAAAPYCPAHEDPAIYRRDDTKLHLAEAYAHNAAREMVFRAVESQRERRHLKEIRVPGLTMDDWIVFTRQVVLDSGEYTAQGEIERRVSAWIEKSKEQDWARLDRIKDRYMKFTTGEDGKPVRTEAKPTDPAPAPARKSETAKTLKRPRPTTGYADAEFFEDEF